MRGPDWNLLSGERWEPAATVTVPFDTPTCSEEHCLRPVYMDGLCKRDRDRAIYRMQRQAEAALRGAVARRA